MEAATSKSLSIETPFKRLKTRTVFVGNVQIGGESPISIQSMTKTPTANVAATVEQIHQLEDAGCEIIRVAVPDNDAAEAIAAIKQQIHIPLVADIHFDYRLAIKAIENGADKIRINPGNIGSRDRIQQVLSRAKASGIPIRIGVNSGSLEKDILNKYGRICAEALVESALRHVAICEEFGFESIVLALKASDVRLMIDSYRLISQKVDYPLHLGVTEAGTYHRGIIKSSIGIGTLLAEGIGDTIRVSLTGDPLSEVAAGYQILGSLALREAGINLISCPTCGRLQVDLVSIVKKVETQISNIRKNMTVAIMGCTVNGPGEAREADLGVACGKGSAILFKKGKIVRKIQEAEIPDVLLEEIRDWK
ncbi:flavodoxin-dependent (E)-4-hydroxy-3-methylbut-2-enyl-diphosphate synthase [candidate division KSB1 bacterium]|nr:flavodoxin-dependent (E)-4-hydroxy-3-methylbut-2-enyl-diphosphate synthase [candidate division KSB1 bacterium]